MDAGLGSDVDVLVELRGPDLVRLEALEERLEHATGRRVQLVRVADARRLPSLLVAATREGRVLTDRDGAWPPLLIEAHGLEAELEDPGELLASIEPGLSERLGSR